MALTKTGTDGIKDDAITLDKLAHGTSSQDGKFLRANNGSAPTFETVNTDLVADTSPQLGGELDTNGNDIKLTDGEQLLLWNHGKLKTKTGATNAVVSGLTGYVLQNSTILDSESQDIWFTNNGKKITFGTSDGLTHEVMRVQCAAVGASQHGFVNLNYVTANAGQNASSATKLSTTATGVTVTGTVAATSYTGDGSNLTGINTDLVSDTTPQLGGHLDCQSFNIDLGDSSGSASGRLKFGNGDLQIYHDGTDNLITASNGHLNIYGDGSNEIHIKGVYNKESIKVVPNGAVELYYDNSKKLDTNGSGGTLYGDWLADANFLLADNDKIKLGNAADLQIYHNGSHSLITNTTGDLLIGGSSIKLTNPSAGHTYLQASLSGSVDLYYNNSKKLETDSNGVRVTASGPHIIFKRSGAAGSNGDRYARILARNVSDTDMGKIEISRDSGTDDSRMDFMTKTAGRNPQPSFRLDSDGTAFFVGKLGRDIDNQPAYFTNTVYGGTTVPNAVSIRTLTNGGETGLLVRGTSQGGGSTDPHSCIRVDATACGNNAKQFGIYLRGRQQLSSDTTGYYGTVSGSYATTYVYRAHLDKNVAAYTNGYSYYSTISESNSGGATYHFRGDDNGNQRIRIERDGDIDNTNNSYGSLSDVKLKENIVDAKSQWDDIKALKVRNFNLKADPNKVKMLGLVAQEAEAVSAGLVKTENDIEIDEKSGEGKVIGQTKYLKYSILYMKAIKALQEAMAKIEILETKVTALEAN